MGRAYSAIQFRTEVEPRKETTIFLSTGSTPTKPRMSVTSPLFVLVRQCHRGLNAKDTYVKEATTEALCEANMEH